MLLLFRVGVFFPSCSLIFLNSQPHTLSVVWIRRVFARLQVSLVVNVASECGFTDEHYRELQQLQRDFGPYHFNVLAFPCNQFGQQEPGSDKEIDSFVRRVYGVSFPLFSKIAVVGTGANNVYKYLSGELDGILIQNVQLWSFYNQHFTNAWKHLWSCTRLKKQIYSKFMKNLI